MKSIYTELALYLSKNKCAMTDNVFSPISEVCNGTVSLNSHIFFWQNKFLKSLIVFFYSWKHFAIELGYTDTQIIDNMSFVCPASKVAQLPRDRQTGQVMRASPVQSVYLLSWSCFEGRTISPQWMRALLCTLSLPQTDLQAIDVLDLQLPISHFFKRCLVWGSRGWHLPRSEFVCSLALRWVAAGADDISSLSALTVIWFVPLSISSECALSRV